MHDPLLTVRYCAHCRLPLRRRPQDDTSNWLSRVFCDRACSNAKKYARRKELEAQCTH